MAKEKRQSAKRILVLGGYGFIGSAVVRALQADGFDVSGAGRDAVLAARVLPGIAFVPVDLRHFQAAGDWTEVLPEFDVVINCAGVLQDSRSDDMAAVHHGAVAALAQAAAQLNIGVIQVSATGAAKAASTEFMRSKARGDAAVIRSGALAWIFRPGLVIGQGAYGGTALLRMLAAIPLVQPLTLAQTPVQSVALQDVAQAVVAAARGELVPGTYDLVEDHPHSLSQVVAETRRWLGFSNAWAVLVMPVWLARLTGWVADLLGQLGWRVPLRTTAIQVMQDGITGDPEAYRKATGLGLKSLPQIYAGLESGREQRVAARMALMMPLAVGVLSLFWLISGFVGFWQITLAASTLTAVGWPLWAAMLSVAIWSLVDLALGAAILWRPWAAKACLAMVAVSVFYLAAAVVFTPALWADPLGPMVKVLPAIMLSLITHQLVQTR